MHRRYLAAIGTTLALATLAPGVVNAQANAPAANDPRLSQFSPMAPAPAEPAYPSSQPDYQTTPAAPATANPVYPEPYVAPAPSVEEREAIVTPPDVIVEPAPPLATTPAHPETGGIIGRGLFNRTGPNDFGA